MLEWNHIELETSVGLDLTTPQWAVLIGMIVERVGIVEWGQSSTVP